jgi:hypothetical protein
VERARDAPSEVPGAAGAIVFLLLAKVFGRFRAEAPVKKGEDE